MTKFAELHSCPVPVYQDLGEFGRFWDFVNEYQPGKVVEIGSLYGGTLWYWVQFDYSSKIVAVDQLTEFEPFRTEVLESRKQWEYWGQSYGCELYHVEGSSTDPEVRAKTLAHLGGESIDFLFIDGDHTYEGVKEDWVLWNRMVKPGGLIAFHDTIPSVNRHEPGVVRFVSELKDQLPWVEFFTPINGAGICVFIT